MPRYLDKCLISYRLMLSRCSSCLYQCRRESVENAACCPDSSNPGMGFRIC